MWARAPASGRRRGGCTIGITTTRNGIDRDEQAHGVEVQDQPPARRQFVGPGEEPAQPARVRTGPARAAAQEAVGLRDPARRQAEAQGLLCQYLRAPVPAAL